MQSVETLKILVIGPVGAGKTTICNRLAGHEFKANYKATIGVDFFSKTVVIGPQTVKIQFWDIAGQEQFGNMTRVYYKDAVGAFVVCDVTRPESFNAAIRWKEDLDKKVSLPNGERLPTFLLANKCDLNSSAEIPEGFLEENRFTAGYLTSAKTSTNLDEAIQALASAVLATGPIRPPEQKSQEMVSLAASATSRAPPPSSNCGC